MRLSVTIAILIGIIFLVFIVSMRNEVKTYEGPIGSTGATAQQGPIGSTGVDLSKITPRIGCEFDCGGWK